MRDSHSSIAISLTVNGLRGDHIQLIIILTELNKCSSAAYEAGIVTSIEIKIEQICSRIFNERTVSIVENE